jgi:hypothetical protein
MATMPAKPITLQLSSHFGKTKSKLWRLAQSLQASMDMVAATDKDAESLMDAVSNFSTAYAVTQESLRSTTTNIAAM